MPKLLLVIPFLLFFHVSKAIECWSFSDTQQGAVITHGAKTNVTCTGNYCLQITIEGSNFNEWNSSCPDASETITDCNINGLGCRDQTIEGYYEKFCCCNSDFCNSSQLPIIFDTVFLTIIINYIFYFS